MAHKKLLKNFLVLLILLSFSACSWMGSEGPSVEPIEVKRVEIPAPRYHPPLPSQVAFSEVKWKVLTPNTMEQYLADLEAGEASVSAYYGLTTQGYENLSNNIADLKRYLSQLKSIVKYYREIDGVGESVGENSE